MNAVGKFGEWIVKHQLGLETFLLVVLGCFIIAMLIQLINRERKKKSLLEEINQKIDGISERIEAITEKVSSPQVEEGETHLDSTLDSGEVAPDEGDEVDPEKVEGEEKTEEEPPLSLLSSEEEKEETADELDEFSAIKGNQSIRFYTRDWGTDKHGNVYTEEILRKQIG